MGKDIAETGHSYSFSPHNGCRILHTTVHYVLPNESSLSGMVSPRGFSTRNHDILSHEKKSHRSSHNIQNIHKL